MRMKDIMSPKVESVRPEETLERARTLMKLHGIHHLVVIDHRKVVGVLADSAAELRAAEGVANVEDAMHRHVVTGTPEMTVRQAASLMRSRAEGALPIMAGQKLVGIVTVSDLLDVLGRGVDRPAAKTRWTLKNRGVNPQVPPSPVRRPS